MGAPSQPFQEAPPRSSSRPQPCPRPRSRPETQRQHRPAAASASSSSSPCEWTQTGRNTLQRELKGFELIINLLEEHNDGNCQLAVTADIEASFGPDSLERRFDSAWYQTRRALPMLGVELPSHALSTASVRAIHSFTDAQAWVEDTAFVIDQGPTVKEVAQLCKSRPMSRENGRLPVLYLVSRPRSGPPGVVLHCSHVLSGHFLLTIIQEFGKQLVRNECELGLACTFQPEVPLPELARALPISSYHAYQDDIRSGLIQPPTQAELQALLRRQAEAAELSSTSQSAGVGVRPDWKSRPSRQAQAFRTLPLARWAAIRKALKTQKVTMTAGFFACIAAANAQLSSPEVRAKATGVECLFSTHTKRWLDTDGTGTGRAPVTMGVIPAGIFLEGRVAGSGSTSTGVNLDASTPRELYTLAKQLQVDQNKAIDSVHILTRLEESGRQVFQETQYGQRGLPSAPPAISKPTLTSQGELDLPEWYGDCAQARARAQGTSLPTSKKPSGSWLRFTDWSYGGRHNDSSVCFSLAVFRGELRIQALYDERYFEPARVEQLMDRVMLLFESMVEPPTFTPRAKL